MKKIIPALALVFSVQVFSSDFDLKAAMKQMKVEFKHAAEATEIAQMQSAVSSLSLLVEQSKTGEYPPEKTALYLEGFNKLSAALDVVESELEQGNFKAAQSALRNVDALREEYHDKRNPSIWSKIFG